MEHTRVLLLAGAMIVSGALSAGQTTARATTAASPTGVAAAAVASPLRLAAIVCGGNGCNAVATKRTPRRKLVPLGHG